MLLSGGSGKRLWPLSNEVRSKAFLKLLRSPDGGTESMIQRVCRGLEEAELLQCCCIVTHHTQTEITRRHAGGIIPVLGEPQKRGTFTAIALAAAYFHSVEGLGPDETVIVLPVDSFVEPSFFELLRLLPGALGDSGAEVALLGTVPRFPSDAFGYIVPKSWKRDGEYFQVGSFIEKPDKAMAEKLISQGALWNCGVFACSLRYLLSCMAERGIPPLYDRLLERYDSLPQESFDREVVEKTGRAVVLPYDGAWNDLGDWEQLCRHLKDRVTGKGHVSEDSRDTHLVNELAIPIRVVGAPGLIIAASPDGILVAGKSEASRIKNELQAACPLPMYEEKRWGSSVILDISISDEGRETVISKVKMEPGTHTSHHLHRGATETWTIAAGSGEYVLGGVVKQISAGESVFISPGVPHSIRALTLLEIIQVETGTPPVKEDIVKLPPIWDGDLHG
ncbi:sugar phosphate nucleotidyltransferase [Paenibacillus sp. M1]|uniref:Sugar phosphate nucleotidyltransferase n=1 Tax=Paenibacillus haidiansis TaxID=1574488 RepID=A0ABU7VY65_9BACL